MNLTQLLTEGDGLSRIVAGLLLLMSVASWSVILWKAWLLRRAGANLARGVAAFWQAPALASACERVRAFDRQALLLPLIEAVSFQAEGTLGASAGREQQLTRALRDALHGVLRRLQFGQTLLATVGSTAPFVGLLGTVWGIYQALTGIAGAGQMIIDRIAGPVGEALIMTAAGLAVAIPAVLAYNVFGRLIGQIEAELEGFAHDLRELMASQMPEPAADLSA
jgi:biopolymer transport protein ExbB